MKRLISSLVLICSLLSPLAVLAEPSMNPEALVAVWRDMSDRNSALAERFSQMESIPDKMVTEIQIRGSLSAMLIDSAKLELVACIQFSQGDYCDDAQVQMKQAGEEMDKVEALLEKSQEKQL